MQSSWSRARQPWTMCAVMCAVGMSGCGSTPEATPEPAQAPRLHEDSELGGLYHDFLDGKFDALGHPVGAEVFDAHTTCRPETGVDVPGGRWMRPSSDSPGTVCAATTQAISRGRFAINVRAAVDVICAPQDSECDQDTALLTITVRDDADAVIGTRQVARGEFQVAGVYQNVGLNVTNYRNAQLSVQVEWTGAGSLQMAYVEIFRATRRLTIAAPSGPVPTEPVQIELLDPREFTQLTLRCGDVDRTAELNTMLADGRATREEGEFRALWKVPMVDLLQECPKPTPVLVQAVEGSQAYSSARVTLGIAEPECAFTSGTTKVLLTGFEPFPADATTDNSSLAAVRAFDASQVAGISVMKLELPVEFDTAPALVERAIERCQPDIVVSFGQGRSVVDIERTGYNLKASSDIAGGVPDNRGIVGDHEPIVASGPSERTSLLPVERIVRAIRDDGVDVRLSDDPGRYVCNNVLYRVLGFVAARGVRFGFVHLPRIPRVDETDRAMLAQVVQRVVEESVAAQ